MIELVNFLQTGNEFYLPIEANFNLQKALDNARSGDTIEVPWGIYEGNYVIAMPNITLQSVNGRSIIRGNLYGLSYAMFTLRTYNIRLGTNTQLKIVACEGDLLRIRRGQRL